MELTSRLDSSEVVSTMQKLSVPLKELKETSITSSFWLQVLLR